MLLNILLHTTVDCDVFVYEPRGSVLETNRKADRVTSFTFLREFKNTFLLDLEWTSYIGVIIFDFA